MLFIDLRLQKPSFPHHLQYTPLVEASAQVTCVSVALKRRNTVVHTHEEIMNKYNPRFPPIISILGSSKKLSYWEF